MGQTLSSPVTAKETRSGGDHRFLYAVSEMQGWRLTMEDAHTIVFDLDGQHASNTFFAVYDGHGGSTVAKFAGQNVHKRLVAEDAYREKNYEVAMKRAFLGTDEDLLADPAHTRDPSGCTAVAALVTLDGRIFVANAGDSRSVISVEGRVKPLSFDHKPLNDVERARISGAGGFIQYGRVNGNLALTRALGDFEFKKNYKLIPEDQIITSNPDVVEHEISEEDEFFVLACDGIWDCLSSQDVVNFVRRKVYEGRDLTEIGEMICDHCLAPDTSPSGPGIGCDNMTILIVAILHGRTKDEWYDWVRDRVGRNYGYTTPEQPPQLYSQSRLRSFRARQRAREERDRLRQERDAETDFGTFAKVFGTGGFSFDSLTDGTLLFEDDSDEDSDDVREPFFGSSFGIGSDTLDLTMNLRAHLAELERDEEDGDAHMNDESEIVVDGGVFRLSAPPHLSSAHLGPEESEIDERIAEISLSSPVLPNGDIPMVVEQFHSRPEEEDSAQGFLDSSEDPLKVVMPT